MVDNAGIIYGLLCLTARIAFNIVPIFRTGADPVPTDK
jgi:putative component of membrane protein insertase Oxa1/YidC/SpoIIIJ protein YidD